MSIPAKVRRQLCSSGQSHESILFQRIVPQDSMLPTIARKYSLRVVYPHAVHCAMSKYPHYRDKLSPASHARWKSSINRCRVRRGSQWCKGRVECGKSQANDGSSIRNARTRRDWRSFIWNQHGLWKFLTCAITQRTTCGTSSKSDSITRSWSRRTAGSMGSPGDDGCSRCKSGTSPFRSPSGIG